MTMYKAYRMGGNNNPFGFLGPLLILTIFFAALFFIARGIFKLLAFVAPFILIITLILDYKVVLNFLKSTLKLLRENTMVGLIAIILGIIGYPIVLGYLFFKALGSRNNKKRFAKTEINQNTFTEFEEIVEDDEFLELPPIKQPQQPPKEEDNKYDHLF